MNTVIGRKIKQTQMFLIDGTRIPVTVVEVSDNAIVGVKTVEKHGYSAVQLGFGSRKKASKSLIGQIKKANLQVTPLLIREVRLTADEQAPVMGELLSVDAVLKPGDIIKVVGISKGKGFAGVVKRHGFHGGPRTHGQSDRERAPGSIGQTTTPGRVYRGKRMAGRMGQDTVSVTNLQVVAVNITSGKKTVFVKGLVPGSVNSIVTIEKTGELSEKKFVALQDLATTETSATTEAQKVDEPVAIEEKNEKPATAEAQNKEETQKAEEK